VVAAVAVGSRAVTVTGEVVFVVSSEELGAIEFTSLMIEVNARLFDRALE